MKKVFFVAAANSIHTVKWVNSLSKYFEIHLIYCPNHKPAIDKIDEKVILHKLKYKAPMGYYANAWELKKMYQKVKPDIVNVHYASGYGTLARMAKLPNVLLSVWGSDVYEFPRKSKLNFWILSKNIRYAKQIISTSQVMADELKKTIHLVNQEIWITPFGIDIERFRKTDNQQRNSINIGIVKTLSPIYGIEYAIYAMKNLKEELIDEELYQKVKLYIYGDGPDKEKLQNLIKENQLAENIFLKGKVANDVVPQILNQFDIFCATSIQESFGVSLLEAMACELPVVATNADGFLEIMKHDTNGIVVNKKDSQGLSHALKTLIEDENLRQIYGKAGREIVKKYYDWNENVKKMREIYEKMI